MAEEFGDRLELLRQPVMRTGLFLMVGRDYAHRHRQLVEQAWDAIGRLSLP